MTLQNSVRKFVQNIGGGEQTEFEVTHNLGTKDVIVTMFQNDTGEEIFTGCTVITENIIKVSLSEPLSDSTYRVVIIG